MSKTVTPRTLYIAPEKVRAVALDSMPDATDDFLARLGVTMDAADPIVREVMDALPTLTPGSAATPVQFLQHWMPKAITIVTQARTADKLLGRSVYGRWEDDSIVLPVIEHTGRPRPYGDSADVPLAGFNTTYEERTVVRFEEGLMTGPLEDARAAASKVRTSPHAAKRDAVAASFALETNAIAFYGWNDGAAHTYGILNDPNVEGYISVESNGATSPSTAWKDKTFDQIVRDINTAIAALRVQTGSNFNPYDDAFRIGIASASVDFLNAMNEHGLSVSEWIDKKFKKARIVPVPEFDGANGGENVMYVIADEINGNKAVEQVVPAALRLLGVERRAKGLFEAYTNATAGAFVQQPLGIVRCSGI